MTTKKEHDRLVAKFEWLQKEFRPVCQFELPDGTICGREASRERGEPWRCEEHLGQ